VKIRDQAALIENASDAIIVRGAREEEALARSTALAHLLQPTEGLKVIGPAAASIVRVKNEYRYQMLLKSASRKVLNEAIVVLQRFAAAEKWNPANLAIDVDPVTLL